MLLLPECSGEEAQTIGARLRVSFDSQWAREWSPRANCPVVSLSVGVAEFDQHESAQALINRADVLMYEAKNPGSARV